jgi:hypothetical protein
MAENALVLDPELRDLMVETKVTCPFLGSLVHQELLSVRGAADNPLAEIEDVRRLGNEGGGDLGDLLAFFAAGNHALMRNSAGSALDAPVPAGLFSLELPGSQGSHPGHSGILQGNPSTLGSGRLSQEDFDRLAKLATKPLPEAVGCRQIHRPESETGFEFEGSERERRRIDGSRSGRRGRGHFNNFGLENLRFQLQRRRQPRTIGTETYKTHGREQSGRLRRRVWSSLRVPGS